MSKAAVGLNSIFKVALPAVKMTHAFQSYLHPHQFELRTLERVLEGKQNEHSKVKTVHVLRVIHTMPASSAMRGRGGGGG